FSAAEVKGCNPVDVCLSRGAAHMALGNYKEALADFSRVLQEDNDNERAHYFRGIALFALADYEKAIADLTFSLARNNNRGIAHLARGMAYAELGEDEFAALDFNSAKAFSSEEFKSFKKLFGDLPAPFTRTRELMARENAPWNNLLPKDSAEKLLELLG
ncbi:MAG: tetratricopeptide repeat protein, partial [Desulfobulbales bacterium]|nr:tetratricopeptide repeat protein [Desulfobulbales bacterium]